jgi:alkylation response protein AidB-like acyl-CoA dehydrogenase
LAAPPARRALARRTVATQTLVRELPAAWELGREQATAHQLAEATAEQQVDRILDQLLASHDPATSDVKAIWAAQFDLGLAWVQFPEGLGGLALDAKLQERIDNRLRNAGVPGNVRTNMMGVGMMAPTVLAHGSDEQQRRYLRPAFACEEIWCQLFSEPGAGSDLAALATRAERDGDEWVVNGQKVWTTLAHVARWGLLLARTDPDQPKHKGLTYFIVDMTAPGVEVRPLRQMTGDAEFNEIFFTDARIPDSNRLGPVGEGWRVAISTLMNERVTVGGLAKDRRGHGDIAHAVRVWQDRRDPDPVRRDRMAQLWIEAEVLRLTNLRAQAMRKRGAPGPEGAIVKLAIGELSQRIFSFIVELLGPAGALISDYEMRRPASVGDSSFSGPQLDLPKHFLATQGTTIGGGTSDIARNILGERVLGLPPEPRVDKDLPWSQVPRS